MTRTIRLTGSAATVEASAAAAAGCGASSCRARAAAKFKQPICKEFIHQIRRQRVQKCARADRWQEEDSPQSRGYLSTDRCGVIRMPLPGALAPTCFRKVGLLNWLAVHGCLQYQEADIISSVSER